MSARIVMSQLGGERGHELYQVHGTGTKHEVRAGLAQLLEGLPEESEPAPWRFDVPEVPDSVTALRDRDGDVWLRLSGQKWSPASWPGDGRPFADLMEHAPLEEHPDPRAAS